MGFLKKFFRNVFREGNMPAGTSSFEHLTEEELETHLSVSRYGNFQLCDAVRPSYDLQVRPCEGYRHDCYHDEQSGTSVPVLMAAVSADHLFDTFMDLLDPLGTTVDVVLETSHNREQAGHTDLYREHIDMPVLKSILWDFEEQLTNDGCSGLAVLNPNIPQEIQFDEHKLIIIYGDGLEVYEEIFREHGIEMDEELKFITEAEHVHSSSDTFAQEFEELRTRLGMDCDFM